MKLIKDEQYAALVAGAKNWGEVVASIQEADPSFDANASAEDVIAALAGSANQDELAKSVADLTTATEKITALEAQIASQSKQIADLKGIPASTAASLNPGGGETSGDTLQTINAKYENDPAGMMRAMKKLNLA